MALQKAFEGLYDDEEKPKEENQIMQVGGEVFKLAKDKTEDQMNQRIQEQAARERVNRAKNRRVSIQLQKITLRANHIKGITDTVKDLDFISPPKQLTSITTPIHFSKNKNMARKKTDKFYQRADSRIDTNLRLDNNKRQTSQISDEVLVDRSSCINESHRPPSIVELSQRKSVSQLKSTKMINEINENRISNTSSIRMVPDSSNKTTILRNIENQELVSDLLKEIDAIRVQLDGRLLRQISGAARSETQSYKSVESIRAFKQLKNELNSIQGRLEQLDFMNFDQEISVIAKEVKNLHSVSMMLLHKVNDSSLNLIDRYKKEQNLINYLSNKTIIDDEMIKRLDSIKRKDDSLRQLSLKKITNNTSFKEIKLIDTQLNFSPGNITPAHKYGHSLHSTNHITTPSKAIKAKKPTETSSIFNIQEKELDGLELHTPKRGISKFHLKSSLGKRDKILPQLDISLKLATHKASKTPSHIDKSGTIDSFLRTNKPKHPRFKQRRQHAAAGSQPSRHPGTQQVSAEVSAMVKSTQEVVDKLKRFGKSQAYDWVTSMHEKYAYLDEQMEADCLNINDRESAVARDWGYANTRGVDCPYGNSSISPINTLKFLFKNKVTSCKRVVDELVYPYSELIGKPNESSHVLEEEMLDRLFEIAETRRKKRVQDKPSKSLQTSMLSSCSKFHISRGESEEFIKFKKTFNKQLRQAKKINRIALPKVGQLSSEFVNIKVS